MDEWSQQIRGSQIPAFGNWDYVNELPITQYFECARQAGLIRYSSSSGECDHPHYYNNNNNNNNTASDLYSVHCVKRPTAPRSKQGKVGEKRAGGKQVREGSRKQAGKVFDVTVTELPPSVGAVNKKQQQFQYDPVLASRPCRPSKAVDEDLYHIPPELLKRKRRLGFFSRCLVPPCAV